MPESSEGSSVPFFTFTSSFSRAAAPCCPPFTRFHFIRRFWNQTFTFESKQNRESFVYSVAPPTSGQFAYIDSFKYIQSQYQFVEDIDKLLLTSSQEKVCAFE